ncbi:cytochrome c3 family protein [Phosphitispora sp. TUW77]|uniref:cytochrome c3 family protein n=1 Tax=Phosphitispora sp. TUW77 TaxID=3152361 RepID=UPI003AB546A8
MSRKIRIASVLAAALVLSVISCVIFINPAQTSGHFGNPHGNYLRGTGECAKCHSAHSATSSYLLMAGTEREMCYACHDSGNGSPNIRGQFGENTIGSSVYSAMGGSFHPVPTGGQLCTTCHNPHLTPGSTPALLAVGDAVYSSGNDVCGNCHGSDSILPGGDMLTAFIGTAHDVDMNSPSSGTEIKCARCHQPHGSPYDYLIRTSITDQDGSSHLVTGNNNTVCFGCHSDELGKFSGSDVYDAVYHGTKTSSTVALTVYSGTEYGAGECLNCHEPHGKTGVSFYRRAEGNTLCITCHDDSSVARPADYSYRGIDVYDNTPHGSVTADNMPVSYTYTMNTEGSAAWESAGAVEQAPTPSAPGSSAGATQLGNVKNTDSVFWSTDLTAIQDNYNYQIYKFHVSQDLSDVRKLVGKWKGYGEPTSNHPTDLLIWNKTGLSWEQLASAQLGDPGNPGTLTWTVTSGFENYLDNNNDVYILVRAKHDNTPPVISPGWGPLYNTASRWNEIGWTTDENATSYVDYGSTTEYGNTVGTGSLVKSHAVRLSGLTAGQTYYYRIRTTDALGNEAQQTGSFVSKSGAPILHTIANQEQEANYIFTINFAWDPVIDPDGNPVNYDIQISTASNFSAIYKQLLDTSAANWSTTVTHVGNDVPNAWYWRVRSKDSYGSISDWSAGSFQTLAWSCPILYTWDGEKFRFITDIVAGSNIGLEKAPGKYLVPTPNEQVTIPGEMLKEKDGKYIIKIKNEQNEVDYIDNIVLQAVDHPIGTKIALNDFVRNKEPYKIYTYSENVKPVKRATYIKNPSWSGGEISPPVDVTELVRKIDNRHTSGSLFDDNQYELDLGDLSGAEEIKLVIKGWTEFATSEERAERVEKDAEGTKTAPRLLEILQPDGSWQSEVIMHIPGYTKTAVIDLTGKFPADTSKYVVRLRGLYRPHIDFIGIDTTKQADMKLLGLEMLEADLCYDKPSSYTKYPAPNFDYENKRSFGLWVHEGKFTRYGDVLPLIEQINDKLVVMDTGDELTVSFRALSPPASGMTRSFVLKPWAYYKELSEAKVDPMPFRAMDISLYPDSLGEYPDELKEYVAEWNTREHKPETGTLTKFKNFIINLFAKLQQTWVIIFNSFSGGPALKTQNAVSENSGHFSLNTDYIEMEVLAVDYSIPNGYCGICHNPHGKVDGSGNVIPKQLQEGVDSSCFGGGLGCHSDPANSAALIDIEERFTTGSNATARHSIDLTEQETAGTRIQCVNCHDPHLNDAANKTVDPDDRYTALDMWVDRGIEDYIYSDGTLYVLAKSKHDGTPPVISNTSNTVNNDVYSATITWTANERSTRQVEWGTTVGEYIYTEGSSSTLYGSSTLASHSVTLSNLETGVNYYYRAKCADALGNTSYSESGIIKLSAPPGAPSSLRNIPQPLPVGIQTQAVRLEWDPALDPDGDQLRYRVSLTNQSTSQTVNSGWLPVSQTFWETSVANLNLNTYEWKVQAKDIYGTEGPYSSVANFEHDGGASCPNLYVWNGKKYEFITDLAGSDVGLEVRPGKFAEIFPDLPVPIPWNKLQEKDGQYIIKLKSERDEVDYIDYAGLQAVDHPEGTRIAINDLVRGKQSIKIYSYGADVKPVRKATYVNNPVYSGGEPTAPVDITELVSKLDKKHANGSYGDDNQFTFDLGDLSGAGEIKLVITGWTEFTSYLERKADRKRTDDKKARHYLEVLQPDGTWQREDIKQINGMTKTSVIDLTGKFGKGTKKYIVRLRGMHRPHIDFVGVDTTAQAKLKITDLEILEASLDYHGVSKSVKYPAPYFDYYQLFDDVTLHEGKFTRYGFVRPLVTEVDDNLVVMDSGDELTVSYKALPPPPPGMTRTFILKPWVYYKEYELAKAEPLPFRGMDMSQLPGSLGEYPDELKKYNKEWNTRDHSIELSFWQKVITYWKNFVKVVKNQIAKLEYVIKTSIKIVSAKTPLKVSSYRVLKGVDPEEPVKLPDHYSLNTNYISVSIGVNTGSGIPYYPNSPTSEAWESNTMPTFETPGFSADSTQKNSASALDGNNWSTDRASSEGAYNYQLYKFLFNEPLSSINRLSVKWVGYGEPTPNHETAVYIWNFATQSWQQLGTGQYNTDTAVTLFRNKENSDFCNRCHDNVAPSGVEMGTSPPADISASAVNDYHGDYVGTGDHLLGPYEKGNRLACDDCHDPHGSANIYHLRETVNGNSGISVTQADGTGAKPFCQSCHSGDIIDDWHESCKDCHNGWSGDIEMGWGGEFHEFPAILAESDISNCFRCHGHNKKWYGEAGCNACHSWKTHDYQKSF